MDKNTQNAIEAATLNRLLNHLDNNKDVQNIDLMILADFCRNCLAKWYKEEAEKHNINVSYDQAREKIYRMPYSEWKANYQLEATQAQMDKFKAKKK